MKLCDLNLFKLNNAKKNLKTKECVEYLRFLYLQQIINFTLFFFLLLFIFLFKVSLLKKRRHLLTLSINSQIEQLKNVISFVSFTSFSSFVFFVSVINKTHHSFIVLLQEINSANKLFRRNNILLMIMYEWNR